MDAGTGNTTLKGGRRNTAAGEPFWQVADVVTIPESPNKPLGFLYLTDGNQTVLGRGRGK